MESTLALTGWLPGWLFTRALPESADKAIYGVQYIVLSVSFSLVLTAKVSLELRKGWRNF